MDRDLRPTTCASRRASACVVTGSASALIEGSDPADRDKCGSGRPAEPSEIALRPAECHVLMPFEQARPELPF